jgi:hypothetical protein
VTRDRVVAATFLALGVGLAASSFALPRGVGGLPGPGFFPRLIGAAMVLLSLGLLWQQRSRAPAPATAETPVPPPAELRVVLGAVGVLALYLLLWGTGLIALRTSAFVLLLLRFMGQPWKTALAVSIPFSAAVVLAFQLGLGVSLE